MSLPQGKLPPALLARLLGELPASSAVVGPRVGEDAAVVAAPNGYLLATSDPITFAAGKAGRHAVLVNANDIAAMGGEPRWFLATVLLPAGTEAQAAQDVFRDLASACSDLNIALVGGHTEVTEAVARMVVAGTMLGVVAPERLVTSSGARPGDALIVSKPVAIEGTALLARDAAAALADAGVAAAVLAAARQLMDRPGISVVPECRLLCNDALPHAMHDVTEGGLATALREMAGASGVGLLIEREAIPVLPECRAICGALGLDPLGLLGSGSLLAAVAAQEAAPRVTGLRTAGMAAAVIGVVTSELDVALVDRDGTRLPLPVFDRDEIARFYDQRR